MAGFDWTWRIILNKKADISWSLTAKQDCTPSLVENEEEGDRKIEGADGIRTGGHLKQALQGAFEQPTLDVEGPDWEGIVAKTKCVHRASSSPCVTTAPGHLEPSTALIASTARTAPDGNENGPG